MPLPTPSDVHVDSALTNISVAILQNTQDFVHHRVFPTVPVTKQSDQYFVFDRGDFNRDEAQKRAPGTESAGSGYTLDKTPTYFCDVYGHHHDIPDQVMANADAALDPEREATDFVTHKMLIRREKDWASTFFTTGQWGTDVTGNGSGSVASGETVFWSDDTNSDPIGDIRAGKTSVRRNTGKNANTLVLSQEVFDILVDHPDIVDRVKYSGGVGNASNPAMVNEQTLAALFGLDNVFVMGAVENTAALGATNSHSFIAGKNALLCHTPASPGLMQPAAGYTFSWTGYLNNGNEMGIAIKRFDGEAMRLREAIRIEAGAAYDQKLVSSELGYFFSSIVE